MLMRKIIITFKSSLLKAKTYIKQKFLTKRSVLSILTIVVYLIAWNRDINLLYGMVAFLISVLISSFVLSRFSLLHMEVHRNIAHAAIEGEKVPVTYRLVNNGIMTKYLIEISEDSPELFRDKSICVEAVRKALLIKSWFACRKRGEYHLESITLRSSYPLGLFLTARRFKSPAKLLVYPKSYPISSMPVSGGLKSPRTLNMTCSVSGVSDEFLGTREYRPGDPLRFIHWKSSARRGKIIIKEFEQHMSSQTTIILDADKRTISSDSFECGVRIAASVSRFCTKNRISQQLFANSAEKLFVPAGKRCGQMIMESLAKIQYDGGIAIAGTISEASLYVRNKSRIVLICSQIGALDWVVKFMKKKCLLIVYLVHDLSCSSEEITALESELRSTGAYVCKIDASNSGEIIDLSIREKEYSIC